MEKPSSQKSGLEQAKETVRALRSENGCPWDRAQTHESLRTFLLEESYEVLEALDSLRQGQENSYASLKEELGDLLLQILLHAEIASEAGKFNVDDLARELSEKLVRRHPHVFGGQKLSNPEEVVQAWEKTKQKEKPKDSALDGIPPTLPALQRAEKVISKVSKMGFQWQNLEGPMEKLQEELSELLAEIKKIGPSGSISRESTEKLEASMSQRIESELGDLLFSVANVAYFLRINPEDALRSMLGRFEKRFRHVEKRAKESGRSMKEMSLKELDEFWKEAKKI